MNGISALPGNIVTFLSAREDMSDIRFVTEFPNIKKSVPLDRVTVAVGIESTVLSDAFAPDENGVLQRQEYCRSAEIVLRFSVHAPFTLGGIACHEAFGRVTTALIFDSSLDIVSSGCGKISEDRNTDALVLEATAKVKTSLCPAVESDMDLPSFFDKTLLCSSHITDETIHLSPWEKSFVSQPVKCGTYFGTGESEFNVDTGFQPQMVFVFAGNSPLVKEENAVFVSMTALALPGGNTLGAELTNDGFKVKNTAPSNGTSARMNAAGVSYFWLAL